MRQSGLRKKGNTPLPPYVPYDQLRSVEVICNYQDQKDKNKAKRTPPTTVFGLNMSGAGKRSLERLLCLFIDLFIFFIFLFSPFFFLFVFC
jgi:hypothetical protein